MAEAIPFLAIKLELRFSLESLNVLRLPALGALGDVELNALSLLKSTEAVGLNCRVMNKYIFTVLAAQKSKTLCIIKPLHCSLFHCCSFPCIEMTLN